MELIIQHMPYIVAVSAYMFHYTIMSIYENYYDSGVPVEYVSHVMIYGTKKIL